MKEDEFAEKGIAVTLAVEVMRDRGMYYVHGVRVVRKPDGRYCVNVLGMAGWDKADLYGIEDWYRFRAEVDLDVFKEVRQTYTDWKDPNTRREYNRTYYAANKAEIDARVRRWRAEHPESARESVRRWYERNREKRLVQMRAYSKRYYETHGRGGKGHGAQGPGQGAGVQP